MNIQIEVAEVVFPGYRAPIIRKYMLLGTRCSTSMILPIQSLGLKDTSIIWIHAPGRMPPLNFFVHECVGGIMYNTSIHS